MRAVLPPAGIVILEIGPTRDLDCKPKPSGGKRFVSAALLQTCQVIVTSGGYHDGGPAECECARLVSMGLWGTGSGHGTTMSKVFASEVRYGCLCHAPAVLSLAKIADDLIADTVDG